MKKRFMVMSLVFALTFMVCKDVFAFQPVGHHVMIMKIADKLPENSLIRESIKEYPGIATWGANGPDIGYVQLRKMLGDYAKWADLFHYEKTGALSTELMREALKDGDKKEIAFAAGWLSHQIGDLEGHKILVNTEAAPALAHPEFDEIHGLLENSAEAYIWKDIAGFDIDEYKAGELSKKFSSVSDIPFDFLERVTDKVYGMDLDKTFLKTCARTYTIGLDTGIGYNYVDYDEAMEVLNQNNRVERLELAVGNAIQWCSTLLWEMENGNYSNLTSRWNLDVGRSESPISAISVKIKTQDIMFAGTDHDIYFGIVDKFGKEYEYFLDFELYNDFERGDDDYYYVYFDNFKIKPSEIDRIYLKKVDNGKPGGDWDLGKVTLYLNGIEAFSQTINKEINNSDNIWSKQLNLEDDKFDTKPDELPF